MCGFLKAASHGDQDARLPWLVQIVYSAADLTSKEMSTSIAAIDAIWTWVMSGNDAKNTDEIFTDDDDEEEDDNGNGEGRKPSCLVVRYMKKFARYFNAAVTLLKSTFQLRRKLNFGKKDTISISVSIQSVSLAHWRTLVDGGKLEEVYSKDRGLELYARELGIRGMINTQSEGHFKPKFCKTRKTPLYVHAEVQLAIHYCLNPNVVPIYGMIGVSKYCCYTCNAFLKFIQKLTPSTGQPMTNQRMVFFVKGTHGTTYDNWLFPIPPPGFNNHSVMEILKGIASDLDEQLTEKTRTLIEDNCMHSDKHSESSGHSQQEIPIRAAARHLKIRNARNLTFPGF